MSGAARTDPDPMTRMLRETRIRAALGTIGAAGDCEALFLRHGFLDPGEMLEQGIEYTMRHWLPELDETDEPWPALAPSDDRTNPPDGISATTVARIGWDTWIDELERNAQAVDELRHMGRPLQPGSSYEEARKGRIDELTAIVLANNGLTQSEVRQTTRTLEITGRTLWPVARQRCGSDCDRAATLLMRRTLNFETRMRNADETGRFLAQCRVRIDADKARRLEMTAAAVRYGTKIVPGADPDDLLECFVDRVVTPRHTCSSSPTPTYARRS